MFYSTVLAATAMAGLVSAQSPWTFATQYSTDGSIAINPDAVSTTLRSQWCLSETNSCRQLCGQYTSNTCDSATLNYTCVCNGMTTPNISDYAQTMPSLICSEWVSLCVEAHPDDFEGIAECRAVTCGNRSVSSSSSSSSSSAAASSTSSSSGSSSTAASSTGSAASSVASSATSAAASATASTGAAVALGLAKTYGTGALAAGILAAFGLAL